jgi:Fe-S-cluster containining protein
MPPAGSGRSGGKQKDMDIRFDCTRCGRCCHDLKLPLSVDEAIAWAGRGHQVQLLCEGLPQPFDQAIEDPFRRYRAERAFEARCGGLVIRINVTLAASFEGPCPHLRSDNLCGVYERRPRVCRIYPVEVVPGREINPQAKACPPEAWGDDQPWLTRGGALVSTDTRVLIDEYRAATRQDVAAKAIACDLLGAHKAAWVNEGYAVYTPSPAAAVAALESARSADRGARHEGRWSIVTNRPHTLRVLGDAGANAEICTRGTAYIGFFPDQS